MLRRADGSLKGNCFITFEKEESATTAIGEMHLRIFMGRKIYVKPGKRGREEKGEKREQKEREERKEEKLVRKKEEKGGSQGWSTLYLNPDTVAEVVA